jgi:hypothetical protein
MGKGNTFTQDLLDHVFLNTALALIGDASGLQPSATAGNLYLALHTADPGAAGAQNTSECAYTSYARTAVPRSGSGFSRTLQKITNVAEIAMPACTGGSETATHWSIGTASSGAGKVLWTGPLSLNAVIFTATTADTLTCPGHTLVVDDRVVFYAVVGITLPTGITAGTVYWVKTVSGNDITISTTQGGSTLDVTAAGGGKIALSKQLAISNGITPKVAAGVLGITEG